MFNPTAEDLISIGLMATIAISAAALITTMPDTAAGFDNDFLYWLYMPSRKKIVAAVALLLSVIGFVWWIRP